MNTNSKNNPDTHASDISSRKQHHIDICNSKTLDVQAHVPGGFEQIDFIHDALPEMALEDVDTTTNFLGCQIALPLFISCMTGGSEQGLNANRELAKAAQEKRVPVGLGSIRVLYEKPELFEHFHMKPFAPDVPILANIGAVQIRDVSVDPLIGLLKKLEVHAIVVHLNPGQELFQPEGDTDFQGLLDAIEQLVKACPIPVIVKETGFGIRPKRIQELLARGVAYVDIAGAGGTNWVLVEACRSNPAMTCVAEEFRNWGLPTALVLDAVGSQNNRILASGGIRSGMDFVKAIALGAHLVGMATPFIRDVLEGGVPAVTKHIDQLTTVLRTTMLLTGATTIFDFQKTPLLRSSEFEHKRQLLKQIDGISQQAT